jgi:hypothetical protein
LGVKVLMLSCGLQQVLAGEITQGGLLSFLLYQEDVGNHVHVSEEPTGAPFYPLFSSLIFWTLGFICLNKTNKQTKTNQFCYGELQIYAKKK